jgi:hypothetical protein
MTALVLTGTLPAPVVLADFADPTVWLIFTAFLFSRAVTETRLGAKVYFASDGGVKAFSELDYRPKLGTSRSVSGETFRAADRLLAWICFCIDND